jgi:hypothetical protein
MNDNLPTRSSFILIVEQGVNQPPTGAAASGGAPTLRSLVAAEQLNRPVLRLVVESTVALSATVHRDIPTLQTLTAAPWPCDLHLDALKIGRRSPEDARARVARRSFDSRFAAPAGCVAVPLAQGNWVDVASLFGGTPAAEHGVMPLTLGGQVDVTDDVPTRKVYLPQMEWATVEWPWVGGLASVSELELNRCRK